MLESVETEMGQGDVVSQGLLGKDREEDLKRTSSSKDAGVMANWAMGWGRK